MAWHEVDDDTGRDDDIGGESVRVDLGYPDVVHVLRRRGDDERVLDEARSFRGDSSV